LKPATAQSYHGTSQFSLPLAIIDHSSYSWIGRCTSQPGYIGNEAQKRSRALKLHYPIHNGIVTNWDEMETRAGFSHISVDQPDKTCSVQPGRCSTLSIIIIITTIIIIIIIIIITIIIIIITTSVNSCGMG
jgi:hypothetical protein